MMHWMNQRVGRDARAAEILDARLYYTRYSTLLQHTSIDLMAARELSKC